jgi:hypothetical protein
MNDFNFIHSLLNNYPFAIQSNSQEKTAAPPPFVKGLG